MKKNTKTRKKHTAERMMPHERGIRYYEHIFRYHFASDLVKGKNVLDAACGSGYGSDLLAKKGANKVTGIDISKEVINFCSKNYKRENLRYKSMDVTDLIFKKSDFDAVVSFETLEHVKNYKKVLSEFNRVLKKDGLLIISTPNKMTFGCNLKVPFDKYHVIEFYLDEFKKLLKKAGFEILEIYGQDSSWKVRWVYKIRCFIVKFPIFGKVFTKYYQKKLTKSDKKVDDSIFRLILRFMRIKLSLKHMKLSKKKLKSAIYFIAICRKL